MRAVPSALQAHLDTGATTLATCWRIERRDGAVHGFTDHDRALSFAGTAYEPETGADGAAIVSTADLAIDNTSIEGALSSDGLSPALLSSGRFDGALVEIWRVNWADTAQRVLLKRGVIGEVRRDGARFTAEIRGLSVALDETRGRVYQRGCDAMLGDARCGVDLDAPGLKAEGAVLEAVSETRLLVSGLEGFAEGWFADGRIDWTGGANEGTSGHVKSQAAGSLSLWAPPGAPVSPGDAFRLHAGCDKIFATCRMKFSNGVNFRGFPLMPGNDAVISYPVRGDNNDGGKR